MAQTLPHHPCPCGSLHEFANCCEPYLNGTEPAPTPEALMRSRYSAYVQGNSLYLLKTWHPDTRPKHLELDPQVRWLGLKIVKVHRGVHENTGHVHFVARYKIRNGQAYRLEENSRFEKIMTQWFYIDGDFSE
ncbi:MAG: YchJ family metal-binding protein [Thiotrichaceae bacterium]|nr:YchJ family metal-binding protein [Thiotrichaceae bacterium]